MKFLILFFLAIPAFADYQPLTSITVALENDVDTVGGPDTDHGYTGGLKLSFITTKDQTPNWASVFVEESNQTNFGLGLSQRIYTPAGIDNPLLTPDDQPYAAWLALSSFYHFQTVQKSHVLELSVGIIGPEANGETLQNSYHRATNYKLAEGWHHQLATEPTLELSYQQRIRFYEYNSSVGHKAFDALALYGGDAGNVLIDGYLGAMARFGFDIPQDLGPTRPSLLSGEQFISQDIYNQNFYFYGFAAARFIGVARNIFLDGNTFKSSHRVKKRPFIFENEVGFAVKYKKISFAWHHVTTTPEFQEKDEYHSFGSVSVSYTY